MYYESHYSDMSWRLNSQLNCLKKISKVCVTGPLWGNPPVAGGIPLQRVSNTANVSTSWAYHVNGKGIILTAWASQQTSNFKAQVTQCRSFFVDVPDHSRPPDLSWSWQNHQIVALAPNLCLCKTASTILVRELYDTGTTEVFDLLLASFPRPLVWPLIWSTRLHSDVEDHTHALAHLLPQLKWSNQLKNDPVTLLVTFRRLLYHTHDHQYVTGTVWPTIATTMYQVGVIASIGIDW